MDKQRNGTIQELMAVDLYNQLECADIQVPADMSASDGLGHTWLVEHEIVIDIPKQLRQQLGAEKIAVDVHIIWLNKNGRTVYSGLVADKADCQLYYMTVDLGVSDSSDCCTFKTITLQTVSELAEQYNPYLQEVVELAKTQPQKLLEYQIFSAFTHRFDYMEMAIGDKVILCGVGVHSNAFLAVGWLGKLINKDFLVAYAECTPQAYQEYKQQEPCLLNRARLLETNQWRFSRYQRVFEKRKKYRELADLFLRENEGPDSSLQVSMFSAPPGGIQMKEYNGPASDRVEAFLKLCQRTFGQ